MIYNEFKEFVNGDYFRVCTISKVEGVYNDKLDIKHLDPKEGLAIEQKLSDDTYIVICFVKWDEDNECPKVDYVAGCREYGLLKEIAFEKDLNKAFLKLNEYVNCIEFALNTLDDLYKEN